MGLDAFIGNLIVGAIGGAWIAGSGYIGRPSKEPFMLKKFLWTVGISGALAGIVATLTGFDPWTLDSGTLVAVSSEAGVFGMITYAIQKILARYKK